MKRTALLIAMTAFPAISFAAASQNTITFKGQVSDQTCQVSVNGNSGSPIVVLPTVASSDLDTAGKFAGETPFTIAVTGCTAPTTGDLNIKTTFLGADVNAGGNLGNTGTAQNVAIQLLDATGGNPIALSGMTSVSGLILKKTRPRPATTSLRATSARAQQRPVPYRLRLSTPSTTCKRSPLTCRLRTSRSGGSAPRLSLSDPQPFGRSWS